MATDSDEIAVLRDIDMDRVVVDPDYRRRIIAQLRSDKLRAEARRLKSRGGAVEASIDED